MKSIFCVNGEWSAAMHTCVPDLLGFYTLPTEDLSVMYYCLSSQGTHERSRGCENFVPTGTLIIPVCRPGYFSATELSDMHCRDGMCDYKPICKPACGVTTQHLQLEGSSTKHLELPWNAVIYRRDSNGFNMICTGSLISDTKIISAAFCFYDSETKLLPASNFQVAVNKMYILYNDTRDKNSQYSDVDKILIPSSYRGPPTYYENNIAIVVVKRAFFFHLHIRPVCLDFDSELDSTQLAEGNSGKTVHNLNVFDLSYLKNQDCQTLLKADNNRLLLTKDKFCARRSNGTWSDLLYRGGGLAFLESTTQRYYLRGVHDGALNATDDGVYFLYISIVKHERFIKEHL